MILYINIIWALLIKGVTEMTRIIIRVVSVFFIA